MAEEIGELKEENMSQKNEESEKLQRGKRILEKKMERIISFIPEGKKFIICRRALPAELVHEIFASLPLENAFGILAKMPNALLARNVRKMLKSIEMAMKNNKWNAAVCGPNVIISGDGLVANHHLLDRSAFSSTFDSIRAILPIPRFNLKAKKPSIAAYFEVKIMDSIQNIPIGYCTQEFPLKRKCLGIVENSFGIHSRKWMRIDGPGPYKQFGTAEGGFGDDAVVGVGMVHFPANSLMKCFVTLNGKLLGSIELPPKFVHLQLFPAVTLYDAVDSIRANFGQEEWRFDPIQILQ